MLFLQVSKAVAFVIGHPEKGGMTNCLPYYITKDDTSVAILVEKGEIMLNIAERRKEMGLSQAEFASRFGVNQNTVSGWELGERTPKLERLIQIAEFFGCTVDELIKKEDT